jgi:hypothetical protein
MPGKSALVRWSAFTAANGRSYISQACASRWSPTCKWNSGSADANFASTNKVKTPLPTRSIVFHIPVVCSVKYSMSSKTKELESSKQREETVTAQSPDSIPPQYFNSEPSGQPPQYKQTPSQISKPSPVSKTNHRHSESQTAGASRASVAAVLAYPTVPDKDEEKEKRSLRERWRDWRQSWNIDEMGYQKDSGSEAKLNYFGARLDGGETKRRSLRR